MSKNKIDRRVIILRIVSISILVIFVGTFVFSSYFYTSPSKVRAKKEQQYEVPFTKHGEVEILDQQGAVLAKFDMEIADNDLLTQQGMMYRSKMEDKESMLFVFDNEQMRYFYMKNTRIFLDIIYVNSNKEVVSIIKNAKPFDLTSLPSEAPAMYVLEIKGGMADKLGIKKGDTLRWQKLQQ